MKLHLVLPLLLVGTRSGHAFVSQTPAPRPATALQAQKNDWFGPAAVAMAGWAMAAQLTFAAPSEPVTMLPGELQFGISTLFLDSLLTRSFWILDLSYCIIADSDAPMKQEIVASPSSMLLSDKIESLDFSFPSYSEATGSVTIKEIPKFTNPFGSSVEEKSDDSEKADKKAAAEAAKEDARAEKAAAADRKAEEKAAAEAKKAEEKAAAEQAKADKAARREEQLAKQKAAVERSTKREVEEEKVRVLDTTR